MLSSSVQDFYEQHGAAFSRTRQSGWAEMELATSYIKPGMTVIDVGAGNGRFTKYIPDDVTYLGIEPSSTLRASSEIPLIEGSLPNLPLSDRVADLTVCFAVFHHLEKNLRAQAVAELIRVTKSDGIIIASTWFLDPKDFEPVEHGDPGDIWVPWKAEGAEAKRYVHAYTLEEWKSLWSTLPIEHIGYFGASDWTEDPKLARNLLVITKTK